MAKNRNRQVMMNIEDVFYDLLIDECNRKDTSLSSYLRNLVLKDLLSSGKVSHEMMEEMLVG